VESELSTAQIEIADLTTALDEHASVAVTDAQGKITFVNDNFCLISQYSRDELLGQDHRLISSGWHSKEFIRDLWTTIKQGKVWKREIKNRAKNGSYYWVDATIVPIMHTDGQPRQFVAIWADITKWKGAEIASLRLEAILESSNDAIISKDLDGVIASWNSGAEIMFGYSAREMVGRSISVLIPPNGHSEAQEILDQVRRGRSVRHLETVRLTKDRRLIHVSVTSSPIRDATGKIIGASKLARDITERVRAEGVLLQASRQAAVRKKNRLLFELTAIFAVGVLAMAISDYTGGIEQSFDKLAFKFLANKHLDEVFAGLSVILLGLLIFVGRQWRDIKSQVAERANIEEALRVLNSELERRTAELSKANDTLRMEIAERERSGQELYESEERFRQIAENISEVFWIADLTQSRLLYVSPAYERIWGRTCESLYASPGNWLEAICPEHRARVARAAATRQVRGNYDETYLILRPDGTTRWIRDRAYPLRNLTGEARRVVGIAEDITEQRILEHQLRQSQKMEAVGQLAGGIAHDFNNILGAINGYAELACMDIGNDAAVLECLESISTGGQRAAALVQQILTFSRKGEQRREPIQLRPVIEEALKLLRATIPSSIQFQSALSRNMPAVLADATQIHQIVMNLGTNSWHAMGEQPGTLEVKLEVCEVYAELAATIPGLQPGRYVRLSVGDTGKGMTPATLARIFEPFFTTKKPGEGTGLGLSVIHGIVQSHDGAITVSSKPGEGTRFEIYFPALADAEIEPVKTQSAAPMGHGERILFVDDEPILAELGRKTLTRLGYAVVAETNVAAGLKALRDRPYEYELVITDLTMPGMTGTEFAQQLLEIRPNLPIILTTGYSAHLTRNYVHTLGIQELLLKPMTPQILAEAVHRVLTAAKTN